jgi:hypothetical protein
MKNFVVALAAAISIQACTQKLNPGEVPKPVKDAFIKSHPDTPAGWEWEDADYEVNFKEGGRSMSCIINDEGTILETETILTLSDLPANAKTYMEKYYKGKKIKEVSKIEKKGVVSYEVELRRMKIEFDQTGKFVSIGNGK